MQNSPTTTPPTSTTPTPPTAGAGVDLSSLDPRKIDWGSLRPTMMPADMSSPNAILTICAGALCVGLFCVAIYYLVRMYRNNVKRYPVLVTSPIRGANFTHHAATMDQRLFPVINREAVTNNGISLPYRGNELSFMQEAGYMPELNNQVQFTLNFWMKVENYSQRSRTGKEGYAILFAQNYGGTGQVQVMYDNSANALVVSVDTLVSDSNQDRRKPEVFRIPSILLLQKWQMVTIVLDNRDLDVYHNHKMTRSFHLDNVPYLGTSNAWSLYPGANEFVGMVSCARYFDYAFDMHEVYRLYIWQHNQKIPYESYYTWWTWYQGNVLTSLYRNIVKDTQYFRRYRTGRRTFANANDSAG